MRADLPQRPGTITGKGRQGQSVMIRAMPAARPPVSVRLVTVDASHAGQRLDNFLIGELKGVPRTRIYRLLRKGEVRINRGRARPDYRLQSGDVVRIPPVRQAEALAVHVDPERYRWLLERIRYEDDAVLVLDKPAGLPVHAGSGVGVGVIEAWRALRPEPIELVHRLDRDTSGCLLLAKSRPVLLALHRAWREGGVDKHYLALVKGEWRGGALTVDAALEKSPEAGQGKVTASARGRAAVSHFRPRERFSDTTLVDVELVTGRMHQARVHAAGLGRPIAGDDKYGARDFNRALHALGLRRLFLHAARLRFPHPATGLAHTVESPLPDDLRALLARLRDRPDAL